MALNSLNQLRGLRNILINIRRRILAATLGVDIPSTTSVSLSAKLRPAKRGSIAIGDETLIAFKTLIYTRDFLTGADRPIRIGRRCFIGGGSTILPGVTIGDECIVGAGAVVFEDVPPRTIVGGNPARILRQDIEVGPMGRLRGADEASRRLWRA